MFNPQARWDRQMPSSQKSGFLNDSIAVSVLFDKGKMLPRFFTWHNRLIKIKRITYSWQEKNGQERINRFCVDTGCEICQISFNDKTLIWKLDKIA